MKRKTNLLKFSLLALFLFISSTAWSASPTFYVCSGANLVIDPGTPTPGITYMWDVKDASTDVSITGYPRAGVPTTLPATGTYKVLLVSSQTSPSATICPPDVVENIFVVLPPITMVLGTPSNATYCAAHSTTVSSEIPLLPTLTLPSNTGTDLIYEYSYTVTTVIAGVTTNDVDGSTIGNIDQVTGTYTLNTKIAGVYTITGKVKYKQAAAFTNKLLGTTGCPATSTTTKVVEVLAAPAAPVITISAN